MAAWFRFSWLVAIGCAVLALRSGVGPTSAASKTDAPAPRPFHDVQPLGSVGCSAASCHGGGAPGKVGSEYNTWLEKDPHSKAYKVLFNDVSRRIAKNLKIGNAHEAKQCLVCHGPSAVHDPKEAASEGVGCEGCHGPANAGYLDRHYQADWKSFDAKAKAAYGLVDTKGLSGRVTQCAVCHVGDADHDVTHDLIAAGHPRMFFEYTSFQDNPGYTPHWREKDPQFDAKAWAIGQAATAKAYAKLTQARAEKAGQGAVWPEFAEYACFSCHQGINGGDLKSDGTLRWNALAYEYARVDAADELAKAMAGRADSKKVALKASEASTQAESVLRKWEKETQYDLKTVLELRDHMRIPVHPIDSPLNPANWEKEVQRYLADAALLSATKKLGGKVSEAEIRRLEDFRNRLRYPAGYNSPKQADPKP